MKYILILSAATCLIGAQAHAQNPNFTLNADEAPNAQPWSEPASFSYSKDKGSKAALSLDAAGKLSWRLGADTTSTGFSRLVAHRNTATGDQVENYALQVGLHFEQDTAGSVPDRNAFYLFHDLSLGYEYKTNFDDEADGCDATPKPVDCVRSHEESLRLEWTLQPFHLSWERVPAYLDGKLTDQSPGIAYSFGPQITFFADDVVDAPTKNGIKPKGTATGAVGRLSLALSPKALDYRLVLRGSIQQTEIFHRPTSRAAGLPEDSTLNKLSLDYDLGPRAFLGESGWAPSIGVSYVKGDDPLTGTMNRERTIFAFKLAYSGG
jgi:hypothetical protein